jgi:uncharacterized 2Fe-2S/4Fe-4S cluster protein (DUF4445 family)
MSQHRLIFWPEGKTIPVEEGKTFLEAADMGGIHINNLCGGQGVCGQCKVKMIKGTVDKNLKSISLLSVDEIQQGYVLACQTRVRDNLEVEIPVEARLEGEQILMEGETLAFSIPAIFISNDHVNYSTIGNITPRGICGSGVIDVLAELLRNSLIQPDGKFNSGKGSSRIRRTDDGEEFVIVRADDSETGNDIVITEYDISNLIKSKGAVYAAATILAKSVGVDFNDMDRIYIAGGFGNHLNIKNAIGIGLLPDLPLERFRFIGNSSLAGARIALLSNHGFEKAHEIAEKMTYFELSVNPDFMNEFVAALFLPHTNQQLFPSMMEFIR